MQVNLHDSPACIPDAFCAAFGHDEKNLAPKSPRIYAISTLKHQIFFKKGALLHPRISLSSLPLGAFEGSTRINLAP